MNPPTKMELHYKSQPRVEGYREIVSPKNSRLKYLTFGLVSLFGETLEYRSHLKEEEAILTLIQGEGTVEIREDTGTKLQFPIGPRTNPFAEKASMVYVPPKASFRVISKEGGMELAFHKAPARKQGFALHIRPEDISTAPTGKDSWRRDISLGTTMDLPIQRLVIGETVSAAGNWSSYPPHKHDERNLPAEYPLEEIYYFLVNPDQGFGLMRVYDPPKRRDGQDEAFVIQNGDTVVISRGYHPVVAAPGYQLYYLYALAGRERYHGTWSDDPAHQWVRDAKP
jgi:5-deoxy-glucuronate isomerase